MHITDEAYKYALIALERCAKPVGFYASGLKGGYEAVWARDSMITSLGAALVKSRLAKTQMLMPSLFSLSKLQNWTFQKTIRSSLETLSRNQAWHGAIPNAVGSWNEERKSDVTFNSIDSSLWYVIGNYIYAGAHHNKSILKKYKRNITAAMRWVAYQDPNNDGLPVQQPTMDWQDIFPHKYGRVLNTQALYYTALRMTGKNKEASRLQHTINREERKTLSLYDKKRGYYLPWVWKYHGPMGRETAYWFDTLGNLLAIVTGLATPAIAKNILRYIEKNKINRPYPCKATWPPMKKGDAEWHWYFETAESKTPYHYSNAGVWPFIGGFYVAALVKARQYEKAEKELAILALANKEIHPEEKRVRDFGFQEWLHGKTGKAMGGSSAYQGWSAGMYVYAYKCTRSKKVYFFD